MLSSFACRQITSHLKAACFRAGVEVIEVNPACTSVIGSVNHAQRHGISVHQGAALAVARRGLGFSERPPQRAAIVPVRHGGHITFTLPARNRAKHVWSYWADIRKKLKAVHVAHFRSGEASAPACASVLGNANRVLPPELRGEIPRRESLSALFGERLGGCSLVMEHLSMVLGTVKGIARAGGVICGRAWRLQGS